MESTTQANENHWINPLFVQQAIDETGPADIKRLDKYLGIDNTADYNQLEAVLKFLASA